MAGVLTSWSVARRGRVETQRSGRAPSQPGQLTRVGPPTFQPPSPHTPSSSPQVNECTAELKSNLQEEHLAGMEFIGTVFKTILSPLQKARAIVQSYPFYPDIYQASSRAGPLLRMAGWSLLVSALQHLPWWSRCRLSAGCVSLLAHATLPAWPGLADGPGTRHLC